MKWILAVCGFVLGLALWLPGQADAAGQPGHTPSSPQASPPQAAHAEPGKTDGHAANAESSAGGHGKPEANPLEWKSDLAIWTAVVFLLLLAVLWKLAWGPIVQGLEKREKRVAEEISSAEKANEEARGLLEQYQQKLVASKDEVRQILDAARRDAEGVGREIVNKAREEAEAEHQRALRDIENATAGALKELADRSATLAVELAGKIVKAKIDPQEHRRLIEQAVAGFSSKNPSSN